MDMVTAGEEPDVAVGASPAWSGAPDHLVASHAPLLGALRSQAWNSAPAALPSRFEQLASAAAGISAHRLRLLGTLLAAATPASAGGRPVLRPIWANEALHRAYSTVRLVGRLEQRVAPGDQSRCSDFETRLAIELAATFDGLAICCDEEPRPCSGPLRALVRDVVELFGPAIGHVTTMTHVDRLLLPAFQTRALVLLANELVTNALLHGYGDRQFGRITVELSVLDQRTARLAVTDDGDRTFNRTISDRGVGDYLADLLQTELAYRTRRGGGLVAEVVFPLPRARRS